MNIEKFLKNRPKSVGEDQQDCIKKEGLIKAHTQSILKKKTKT